MQIEAQATEQAAEAAAEGFNAGDTIIEHVANSGLDHPLIHLPTIGGIDFSVTKHVLMLWLVALVAFTVRTLNARRARSARQGGRSSTAASGLEYGRASVSE